VSVILGPSAGGAVYSPALTDFVLMVQGTAHMFITGPQVIKAVSGEEVSAEELGGALTHNQISGNSQLMFPDEPACLAGVRTLLSYLPQNNLEDPPQLPCSDSPDRRDPGLREAVPVEGRQSYDVREVIRRVLDLESFFELHAAFAPNLVVGYGRLMGQSVGVVANQPLHLAGSLDINASDKAARFIRTCDAFNVPLITFVDTPGYLPGKNQEFGGIIRHGAKLLYAYSEATVPKLTVTLRKAYGGAYIAMCNKDLGADLQLAWPQAEIAVMGAQGAANIIYRKDIEGAADPAAKRKEKIDEYDRLFANPYEAAKHGLIDLVIAPEDTRPTLVRALQTLRGKRESLPARKHGNIPL
jgi:acetyl-CoA carboxylase carboxyltransferase component